MDKVSITHAIVEQVDHSEMKLKLQFLAPSACSTVVAEC